MPLFSGSLRATDILFVSKEDSLYTENQAPQYCTVRHKSWVLYQKSQDKAYIQIILWVGDCPDSSTNFIDRWFSTETDTAPSLKSPNQGFLFCPLTLLPSAIIRYCISVAGKDSNSFRPVVLTLKVTSKGSGVLWRQRELYGLAGLVMTSCSTCAKLVNGKSFSLTHIKGRIHFQE